MNPEVSSFFSERFDAKNRGVPVARREAFTRTERAQARTPGRYARAFERVALRLCGSQTRTLFSAFANPEYPVGIEISVCVAAETEGVSVACDDGDPSVFVVSVSLHGRADIPVCQRISASVFRQIARRYADTALRPLQELFRNFARIGVEEEIVSGCVRILEIRIEGERDARRSVENEFIREDVLGAVYLLQRARLRLDLSIRLAQIAGQTGPVDRGPDVRRFGAAGCDVRPLIEQSDVRAVVAVHIGEGAADVVRRVGIRDRPQLRAARQIV